MAPFPYEKYKKLKTLICTPLRFYSQQDENLLFQWIKKVKCIKSYKGIGKELHLYLSYKDIPYLSYKDIPSQSDLANLMGIFKRYKFDCKQLEIFKKNE